MHRHADLGAPAFERTATAKGRNRSAEVLTERDQQVVVIDPVPLRQLQSEGHLGLLGGLGADVTPAIRDPMDMRIDADPRLSIPDCYNKVGGLPANAGKTQERLNRIGARPSNRASRSWQTLRMVPAFVL